jgi:tRNA nucleotidyltransferase (CCA-adding enzyme)
MMARGARTVLSTVGRAAADEGLALWLVGGAVRDGLLSRGTRDLDFVLEASAGEVFALARRLGARAGWRLAAEHPRFGTATLLAPAGIRVDLAAARSESYPCPASLPVVSCGAGIDADLGRRDVTIHAMARRVGRDGALGTLRDPFGGRQDLEKRTLRLLHDRSLIDDPTRAFRVVRYAARLGFGIDPRFDAQLRAAREAGAFRALTGDRLRRALEEVLGEDDLDAAVRHLLRARLLDEIRPGWSASVRRRYAADRERREAGRPEEAVRRGANRLVSLLEPLPDSRKRDVAERLRFSRALRRAAGVPLR